MRDFKYYEGSDIKRPEGKVANDFATISAELKTISGDIVDTISIPYSRKEVSRLSNAGYKVTIIENDVAYKAHLVEMQVQFMTYNLAISIREDDFVSDFAKDNNITVEAAAVRYSKAKAIHKNVYTDIVYDLDSFNDYYPTMFEMYYAIMDEL